MRALRVAALASALTLGCHDHAHPIEARPDPSVSKVDAAPKVEAPPPPECLGVGDEPDWRAILAQKGKTFTSDAMFCVGRAKCTVTARIDTSPKSSRHVVRVLTGDGCGNLEYWLVDVASSIVRSISLLVVSSAPCLYIPPEHALFTDPKTFVWYESTHGAPGPGGGTSWPHTIALEPWPHAADDDAGRTCPGSIPVVRSVDY